jgi:hypothetical protein
MADLRLERHESDGVVYRGAVRHASLALERPSRIMVFLADELLVIIPAGQKVLGEASSLPLTSMHVL